VGKVLYWIGGIIRWFAYIRLVTGEVFEEICYAKIGDSIRAIVSAAETRQYAPKVEQRTLSAQRTAARAADNA